MIPGSIIHISHFRLNACDVGKVIPEFGNTRRDLLITEDLVGLTIVEEIVIPCKPHLGLRFYKSCKEPT